MNIQSVQKTYDTPDVHSGYIIVKTDNSQGRVPLDEENTDYKLIQEWIADGNTPT